MSEELKSCPFCGGAATIYSDYKHDPANRYFWALCDNDSCVVECFTDNDHYSEESASTAWNTRPNSVPKAPRLMWLLCSGGSMNNKGKKKLRYSFRKVIEVAENMQCKDMHHKKDHQHEIGEMCPVEYELNKHIHDLREYFKSQGI